MKANEGLEDNDILDCLIRTDKGILNRSLPYDHMINEIQMLVVSSNHPSPQATYKTRLLPFAQVLGKLQKLRVEGIIHLAPFQIFHWAQETHGRCRILLCARLWR